LAKHEVVIRSVVIVSDILDPLRIPDVTSVSRTRLEREMGNGLIPDRRLIALPERFTLVAEGPVRMQNDLERFLVVCIEIEKTSQEGGVNIVGPPRVIRSSKASELRSAPKPIQ
jgi:hypothetical protein